MKHTLLYLSILALVLTGALNISCSEVTDERELSGTVTLTTTVTLPQNTKALSESGVKTFANGDKIAVVYTNISGNTVKVESEPLEDISSPKVAKFKVTLTDPDRTKNVTIIYPAAMAKDDGSENYEALYTSQDGSLTTIASSFDYCSYTGAWNDNNLPTNITLVNQLALVKFTLQQKVDNGNIIIPAGTALTVNDGTQNYIVTPTSATTELYVAIRATNAVNLSTTVGGIDYSYHKTGAGLTASNLYDITVKMDRVLVNLANITGHTTLLNGDIVTGTLGGNYKISIADGATVTMSGVNINGSGTWTSDNYAGLNCIGNATIILAYGTTNTVKGFRSIYPGIHVSSGSTLTIQGTGTLNASSNGMGAGIGAGRSNTLSCGNIIINDGTITATGGSEAAGIGCSHYASCGDISITGGTVEATGGMNAAGIGGSTDTSCGTITISGGTVTATGGSSGAGIGSGCRQSSSSSCETITISGGCVTATGGSGSAGIGSGSNASCGDITIENSVTSVTATKGSSSAQNSIGKGYNGSCGTVTINGTEYYDGSAYQNNGNTYLATSPLVYKPGVALANSTLGYKVCSDGKAYPVDVTLPGGVTLIGMVARKSGSSGIVLYKEDTGKYTWENRNSGNPSAVNVYVDDLSSTTSKSWTCGEKTQYENCGVTSYGWSNLQTRLSNAGCIEFSTNVYWTNTETSPGGNNVWYFYWDGNDTNTGGAPKNNSLNVRPLFTF